MRTEHRTCIVALVLALAAAACGAKREPSYEAHDLAEAGIQTIAVAPIVDARENKFRDVAVLADVRKAVEGALSERGYAVVPAQLARGGEKLTSEEIARMNTKELAAAAPKDVRFLLIPSVESITRGVGELGKTVDIKLGGRLVDL